MKISFKNQTFKITDEPSFLKFKRQCEGSRNEKMSFKIIDANNASYHLLGYFLYLQKKGVKIELQGEERGMQLIESILQRN